MLVLSSAKTKQVASNEETNMLIPAPLFLLSRTTGLSEKGTEVKTKKEVDCRGNVNEFVTLYVWLFLFCYSSLYFQLILKTAQ